MSTIYILWLRQIKRFLRSKSRIAGSLGQPVLFLLALGFGFGPIYQKAGSGNYIQFLAPGVIAMSVLFSAVFFGIETIWDREFGFLKETLVAPVSRMEIMLGRTLGGATVSTCQGLIVFGISMLVGFEPQSLFGFLLAAFFMFLIAVLFTAFGTALASKMEDMHAFQLIMNFFVMPLFFLSGALFPLNNLPPTLSVITKGNPLSYGVDALRGTLINASHFGLGLDLAVLSICTFVVLFIGSWLFSKTEV